jgi:hypothetical protein
MYDTAFIISAGNIRIQIFQKTLVATLYSVAEDIVPVLFSEWQIQRKFAEWLVFLIIFDTSVVFA